jgi:cytochrome P450
MSEDELLGMAWPLLTAGHTTTVDLIGSGGLALLRNPDQLAALRADRSRLPAVIEEIVRFDGAIELGISRFTTDELTVHYCLGAPLARMEAAIGLGILLDRFEDLSLAVDPDQIAWQVNPHMRGPATPPVRFTPYGDAR